VHPDDVAEYVVEEVERTRERLEARADLNVAFLDLEDDVQLYVGFDKVERPVVTAVAPAQVQGPGGIPVQFEFAGVDLSQSSRRQLVAHLDCTDFDGQPPTAELMLPDRTPLLPGQWPKDLIGQGIVQNHPDFKRPFFCRPGFREFHTHPQHEDEPWDKYRESITLVQIVIDLLDDLQHRWVLTQ
jgi:hypothetical protein